jgi:ribosomal protein S18 acetylase RimI-like enzyme
MNISIVEKDIKEIELIKPLWEQLNLLHFEKSVNFKFKYEKFTFEDRIKAIYVKAGRGIIKIDMILDNDTNNYIGYCLCSIEDNIGEIESIYVEKQYRKLHLGGKLMESALNWFSAKGIANIQISVVYSNDEALPFYQRYGFQIANYVLSANAISN